MKNRKKTLNQNVMPNLIGHPETNNALDTTGSSGRADAYSRMTTEYGRSMVEMLGVLAVVSVLSVTGISFYNSAMNRHKANELLNEASKRAVVAGIQFSSGKNTVSLSEFTNNNLGYATFATEIVQGDNENQFKLILEQAPSPSICTQMKSFIGLNTLVRKINVNCTQLSFNKDLSSTVYSSDFDNDKTMCLAQHYQYCSSNKCLEKCCNSNGIDTSTGCLCYPGFNGEDCENTVCQTGQYCGPTTHCCQEDELCTTDGDLNGTCLKIETGCHTNEDCEKEEKCLGNKCYCEILTASHDCDDISGGRCVIKPDFENVFTHIPYQNKSLYIGPAMNWWTARNFCLSYQMHLTSLASLGLTNSYTNNMSNGQLYQIFSPYFTSSTIQLWTRNSYNNCLARSLYIQSTREFINNDRRAYDIRTLCE